MKDMYYGKQLYAERKMRENAEIESLTEEQHAVLAELCRIRHEFHSTDSSKYFNSEVETDIDDWFWSEKDDNIYNQLEEVGLPELKKLDVMELPSSADWNILIYEENELKKWEEKAEKFNENSFNKFSAYEYWASDKEEEISKIVTEYNDIIEKYLKDIDDTYGTKYCPTGIARSRL